MADLVDVNAYYNTTQPDECRDFIMQQTMIRVKDPRRSLDFYCKVLGMHLIHAKHFPQWKFSLYFVGYCNKSCIPEGDEEKARFCRTVPGCIELTHNHGTETQEGQVYNTGNSDGGIQGGFGHIGITVPDVYAACERFHKLGVEFKKSPNGGGMKGLAFVKDPDGYWIEILTIRYPSVTQKVDCLGVELE
eukprot:c17743_g1_i1.p1 GENE.c17743_g1_i1~~c17743_g1_i1.p1  ORF type:complete len:200 (+),score=69.62 c17743_g1_i1:32-601(+)